MKYNLVVAGGGLSGVAVAIAYKTNTNAHTVNINAVQQRLKENGAVL
jgi:anaerobic glycerol-3-phosphate dehydrogenase